MGHQRVPEVTSVPTVSMVWCEARVWRSIPSEGLINQVVSHEGESIVSSRRIHTRQARGVGIEKVLGSGARDKDECFFLVRVASVA